MHIFWHVLRSVHWKIVSWQAGRHCQCYSGTLLQLTRTAFSWRSWEGLVVNFMRYDRCIERFLKMLWEYIGVCRSLVRVTVPNELRREVKGNQRVWYVTLLLLATVFCVVAGYIAVYKRRRRRRRFPYRQRGSLSCLKHIELARLNPVKLASNPMSARWLAQLAASIFNGRLSHSASSPSNMASYSYTELTISSLAVAATIASSTHCTCSWRDG